MSKIPVPQQWNAKLDQPITPAAQQFLNAVADNSGGGGGVTDVSGTLPVTVATGTTTPVVGVNVMTGDSGAGGLTGVVPAPATGDATKFLRGDATWATPSGGSGTVTSVDLSMPAEFAVAGGPITASGTLAVTKATQNANLVYAGPSTGSAATPTFRALTAADLPGNGMVVIAQVVTTGSQTVVTFSSIPQNFTSLKVIYSGRDTSTTVSDSSVLLVVNSDTVPGNYLGTTYVLGTGGSATSGVVAAVITGVNIGWLPGGLTNASAAGSGEILIPNYTGTVFQKLIQSVSYQSSIPGATNFIGVRGVAWKNTAAITTLAFRPGKTAFVDGTTFTLYGL